MLDRVSADNNSVAIGSNSMGNIININDASSIESALRKVLKEQSDSNYQKLEKELGVTKNALTTFFNILKKDNVPECFLLENLIDIANKHRQALSRLNYLQVNESEYSDHISKVRLAIEQGEYSNARVLLKLVADAEQAAIIEIKKIEEEAKKSRVFKELNLAKIIFEIAETYLTERNFKEAASSFKKAIKNVPNGYNDEYYSYYQNYADALREHGKIYGDICSLEKAIDAYEFLISGLSKFDVPLWISNIYNNLGLTKYIIAQRQLHFSYFKDAIECYQKALTFHNNESLDWAMIKNNLGNSYSTLGEVELNEMSKNTYFKLAIEQYELSLVFYTKDKFPKQCAMANNNIGNALQKMGELLKSPEVLDSAKKTYIKTLEGYPKEDNPFEWAIIKNNLANVYSALGQYTKDTKYLLLAEVEYNEALNEQARENAPMDWAMTKCNIGALYLLKADFEPQIEYYKIAQLAYKEALEVYSVDECSMQWSNIINSLSFIEREIYKFK